MAMPAGDSVDRLSFPVLCLARDTTVTVAHTAAELQRCHALAFFKNRYFDDLIVLDARGEQFRVVHTEIVPALTGVRPWWIRAFNRRLTVRLGLERLTPASLATTKQQLRAWLRKAPDFWEASHDLAEWERRIDAIPGERLLRWLGERLRESRYETTTPEPEDWGWYIDVTGPADSYLVGASGADADGPAGVVDWTIQLHKHRSLKQKITGRNKLAADDPLSALLERLIRQEADAAGVEVTKEGLTIP